MKKQKEIPVYVKYITIETPKVKRFTLAPMNGATLPPFSAGSHITTYIRKNGSLLERSYSLNSHPDKTGTYDISILLSDTSKGGSHYWHTQIKVGEQLTISYPKNYFPLSFKAKHHVFYAAGIGITPFLSMMKELQETGGSFELHYAAKSRELCSFYSLLKEYFREQCTFYFSEAEDSERLSPLTLLEHNIGTHVYFCGPETFIAEFSNAAIEYGYPKSSIHFERFSPPAPKKTLPFEVELKTGETVFVSKNQTLLNSLILSGINVPYSCQVGRCGTCEVKVLEGEVDHYDQFLSEEQKYLNKSILTCVSRAKSERLVLDIN
ncbi:MULTISPECIES: PDR/VanB family oxidoreductase [Bacillus]|uniref:PDR/VanB family oxidoreductase n=1 Tax=Bacillus TaxID=1386 RepID=UPI001D0D7D09|nr:MULTISPECIES: PDR/VanB family oxidoreductase [Bacillus]